jgi:superfamily I DNA/RNA helicase family protein
MDAFNPTPEQDKLIQHEGNSLFVTAVPGAGKTRTMAQRFIRVSKDLTRVGETRGIAALSFTNLAASEIEEKVRTLGGNASGSNFIGTIDKFLRQFLIIPAFKSKYNVNPDIRDEWIQFGALAEFSLPNDIFNYPYIKTASLADFNFLNDSVSKKLIRQGGGFKYSNSKEKIINVAKEKREALSRQGYFDVDSARDFSIQALQKNTYDLVDIMAARFREVILDEVQDCNATDLLLLEKLHDKGVRLILIGDLDQDIYEFRGSNATEVQTFCQRRGFDQVAMTSNFRSTPEICDLVTYLRKGSAVADVPVKPRGNKKVQIFVYNQFSDVTKLAVKLDRQDFRQDQGSQKTVVLAATSEIVSAASCGRMIKKSNNISKSRRILTGITMLRASLSSPKIRNNGIRLIESGILESCIFTDGSRIESSAELEKRLLERGASARLLSYRIAFETGVLSDSEKVKRQVSQKIVSIVSEFGLRPKERVRFLPPVKEWPGIISDLKQSTSSVNANTIHGSKGAQYDRVILVLDMRKPNARRATWAEEFIELLEHRRGGESRRLFYVGASRAKEELILAVDYRLRERLENLLRDRSIDFENLKL